MYSFRDIYGNAGVKSTQEQTTPDAVEQTLLSNEETKPEKPKSHSNIIFYLTVLLVIIVLFHFGAGK